MQKKERYLQGQNIFSDDQICMRFFQLYKDVKRKEMHQSKKEKKSRSKQLGGSFHFIAEANYVLASQRKHAAVGICFLHRFISFLLSSLRV